MPMQLIALVVLAGVLAMASAFAGVYGLSSLVFQSGTRSNNKNAQSRHALKHRLQELKKLDEARQEQNPLTRRLKRKKTVSQDLRETVFKLVEPMSRSLYGQNAAFQARVKTMLTEAGQPDNDAAVWRFMASRLVTGVVVGSVLFFISNFFPLPLVWRPAVLVAGLLIGGFLPQIKLQGAVNHRKNEIRFHFSDVLDMMVVCVEAGLSLDATIQRVGEESERLAPELAQELQRINRELNAGVKRAETFHNLALRTGVEEVKSLCALIIQSDKLGTSMGETLRIFADDLRTRRRQKAEELAAKASVKMTFPLVLFIMPPLFIVLLGPMVIQALGTFFGGKG